MAAGAGLWLLAIVVTVLHFVITYGFTAISRLMPGTRDTAAQIEVVYANRQGVLRHLLDATTSAGWQVTRLIPRDDSSSDSSSIVIDVVGSSDAGRLVEAISALAGVTSVGVVSEDDIE